MNDVHPDSEETERLLEQAQSGDEETERRAAVHDSPLPASFGRHAQENESRRKFFLACRLPGVYIHSLNLSFGATPETTFSRFALVRGLLFSLYQTQMTLFPVLRRGWEMVRFFPVGMSRGGGPQNEWVASFRKGRRLRPTFFRLYSWGIV
jgi:hypothetical protein